MSPADQFKPPTAGPSSILEEDTSRSLAATLALARTKGYVDKTTSQAKKPSVSISSAKKAKLEAKAYIVEEKRGEGERGGRGEGFRGSGSRGAHLREVKEPEDYKPEINIEYTDDTGRKLNTKEAFKHMCYRFHGKGPGKNKIDKRLKKLELERKMQHS